MVLGHGRLSTASCRIGSAHQAPNPQILIESFVLKADAVSGLKAFVQRRPWVLVVTLAVFGLVIWLLTRQATEELVYNGKSLHAWAMQLSTNDANARAQAADAFHSLGSNAVPGLTKLAQTPDPFLRRQIWAWSLRTPKPVRRFLMNHVQPPKAMLTRVAAARALQVIGPQASASAPVLGRLLRTDTSQPVRFEAALALAAIGPPGLGDLTNAAFSGDPNVRYAAINGLGATGPQSKAAVGVVVAALQDPDPGVRLAAINGIAKFGTNAFSYLTEALSSDKPATRREAAQAMTHLHVERQQQIALLWPMLSDADATCRAQAVRTLGAAGLPNPKTMAGIAGLLDDNDQEVRLTAIEFFHQAHWRAAMAVPGLSKCLINGSPVVRTAAAQALAEMGAAANSALPALTQLTNDEEQVVRTAARNAVAKIQSASIP